MNSMVNGYASPLSFSAGLSRTGTATGGAAAQTRQAAGTLAKYMRQNGIETLTPNQLYALTTNASGDTPQEVSEAAEFMLANPDIYGRLETRDAPGSDGIAGAPNFDFAARGGLDAEVSGESADNAIPMDKQTASDALANFMHQNREDRMDPDRLYQLAMRPNSDTSPAVSAAAKFMLRNPGTYRAIETHDVAGADGISGAGNFEASAQASPAAGPSGGAGYVEDAAQAQRAATLSVGLDDIFSPPVPLDLGPLAPATPMAPGTPMFVDEAQPASATDAASGAPGDGGAPAMNEQTASGALAAYMRQKQIDQVDPNMLYQLAMKPDSGTPQTVQAAAKFMLQNPETFHRVETNQGFDADGIADLYNLDAAATGSAGSQGTDRPGDGSAAPADEQAASGVLASYMRQKQIDPMDPNTLYQLAMRPDSDTPPAVTAAAKFMLQNPEAFRRVETHEVANIDGIATADNLENVAQGKQPLDAQSAAGVLADHFKGQGIAALQPFSQDSLKWMLLRGEGSPEARAAAAFMLRNPEICNAIEAHGDNPGVINLEAAARGEIPGVPGKAQGH
ncbi:hypothetical protein M4R22_12870 [Acidovorax sp. GBBC 3334]|uniref:hypothetical protein n=1 Tax=Acidovorax sp. GBBC 3334 TaxID=2940496 RepID=UPI002302F050|nr:hypothetical protein [Acidovorax sp. GBBC 3334]MDA8455658.1 hypothetical protein [Acidovorax sp. GBBC 3334]